MRGGRVPITEARVREDDIATLPPKLFAVAHRLTDDCRSVAAEILQPCCCDDRRRERVAARQNEEPAIRRQGFGQALCEGGSLGVVAAGAEAEVDDRVLR